MNFFLWAVKNLKKKTRVLRNEIGTDARFPAVGMWENINVEDKKFKSLFPPVSKTVTIIRDP